MESLLTGKQVRGAPGCLQYRQRSTLAFNVAVLPANLLKWWLACKQDCEQSCNLSFASRDEAIPKILIATIRDRVVTLMWLNLPDPCGVAEEVESARERNLGTKNRPDKSVLL